MSLGTGQQGQASARSGRGPGRAGKPSAKILLLALCVVLLGLWGGCQSDLATEDSIPGAPQTVTGDQRAASGRQLIDCEVDQNGTAHIVALITPEFEGLRPAETVPEESPGETDHGELLALLRAEEQEKLLLQGSVLPFRRYPYRWTLEGTSTQLSSVVLPEPRAVYVTDYAWSFRPAISAFPTADGTYTYKWVWSVWRDRWLPGGDAIFAYTLSGGGTQATLTLSVNGYYPTVLHSGGPLSSYSMTLGLLMSGGEMRTYDEEYLENWVAGTWSLTHDLNGDIGEDGKLDLRMLRTRNLAAVPQNFQPELDETTTIQADMLALPVATELFPQGWQPTGNFEWRIQAMLPYYPWQRFRTLTGTVPVSAHDSEGKVAHIEQVWDGLDGNGIPVSGSVYLEARTIAPVDTSGNARTREFTTALLGPMFLEVENLRPDLEVFDPAKETTVLSANIATRSVTNVRHQVTVRNPQGTAVRTFPERSGVNVREVWDGRNDQGGFPGYGRYTWEVKATCAEGLTASETDAVRSDPPFPVITRIQVKNGIQLVDAEGRRISDVYYDRDRNLSNPVAVALSALPAPSAGVVGRTGPTPVPGGTKTTIYEVTFELPGDILTPVDYEWQARTPEEPLPGGKEEILKRSLILTYGLKERRKVVDVEVTPQRWVRIIYKILWYGRLKGDSDSDWRQPQVHEERMYVTLNPPKEPVDRKTPVALMEFACRAAVGANEESEAREKVTRAICLDTLGYGFKYSMGTDGNAVHTDYVERRSYMGIFHVNEMLLGNRMGNCEDFSNLFQVSCAALGVAAQTLRIEGPFGIKPYIPVGFTDWFEVPQGRIPPFNPGYLDFHQVGCLGPQTIYDPTYQLPRIYSDNPWVLQDPFVPVNETMSAYRGYLEDARFPNSTWEPLTPTRPLISPKDIATSP